ncbi:hypothetical protein MLD38_034814 [Melastoma candidum]|uniref:Uncharacterized protein n=1 Tax=Melastoma candidum TaxID=119954 RepID=A0ACB9MAV6_9MYRT|nr:hypothetical protein MLD38_034814 [Melastoma candidum]
MGLSNLDLFPRKQNQKKHHGRRFSVGGIGFDAEGAKYLIIKLPNSRIAKVLVCAFIMALFIMSFPWLKSFMKTNLESFHRSIPNSEVTYENAVGFPINEHEKEVLPLLFHDLANEGLLKARNKVVFLSRHDIEQDAIIIPGSNDMEYVSVTDLERQSSVLDNTVDFAFTFDFPSALEFIDRTLMVGGIAATYLSGALPTYDLPSNYKIVYFRKFKYGPAIALKKTDQTDSLSSPMQRRLCGFGPEQKKAALENLEDVLLEPPRAASGISRTYLKKTKYLPDLMGDSLESYPRRVFINVGLPEKEGEDGTTQWFSKHYPTRNLDFDMYKIETVGEDPSSTTETKEHTEVGMSDWLRKNVKEEEYVVMKADAEVMEEMVKHKEAVRLVDELFLECKPRGPEKASNQRSRRAYWECLALYGRLRDEGIAVHQWWG